MEGLMRRACTFLLAACAVLALGSGAGSTAQAARGFDGGRPRAPSPLVDPPPPDFFVYLPTVAGGLPAGVWTTIVEEGFETPPGDLWDFRDLNEGTGGIYHWARRDCQPYAGSYSAWAVGGGANGASLPCGSNYPDRVDSWMAYGPFSLEDATAANLSFRLWLDIGSDDEFRICVSPDDKVYNCWSLSYQPPPWERVPFALDNDAVVDMRGQSQVWVALNFVTDLSVNFPGGAYVDDIVIRKCAKGICSPAGSSGSTPAAGRVWRSAGARPAMRSAAP
jgi:hypothetical protein